MKMKTALDITIEEFMRLSEIPHPSHYEEKIGAYLMQWAEDHGLAAEQDELGDVIINKPASPGCENAPLVILQAHMDMVCTAADGVAYDPFTDPIIVLNDGVALTAQGTSLGADDGIGVALCLYILQASELRHGPVRAILTVNEEDGMSAIALSSKYLDGSYLINLDWEWLGSLCNSSAGADYLSFSRQTTWTAPGDKCVPIEIELKGLLGGHSGVDIHRGRANALVCIAAALSRLIEADIAFGLADFHGGQAKNAIPDIAKTTITVAKSDVAKALNCLEEYKTAFADGFGNVEPAWEFIVQETTAPVERILTQDSAVSLISLLSALPNNVHTMSPFVPTLVESSLNLGLLSMDDSSILLSALLRSSASYRIEELCRASGFVAKALGFEMERGDHVPAWAMNPKSHLTPLACACYKRLTGEEMVIEPIHGGLECGAFFEKNPNLDMIAIGPSITDVHTPNEACDIHSIGVTVELIVAILEELA